jgi:N-acetylmuramoyl-L-alanine amidase
VLRRFRFAVLGVAVWAGPVQATAPLAQAPSARFRTVVIDAGHGGDDHGARGPKGLLEKDLVLDLARGLAARLGGQGLSVVMTRDADRFVTLDERTRLANQARADLFVSIHANASRLQDVRGIETFFAAPEATDESARALARQENLAFGEAAARMAEGDPLRAILGDLLATAHLADAQEFARLVQRRLAAKEVSRSRGVKQAPFVVLMGVHAPAVLVEVGFITNAVEEGRLSSAAERKRLVSGLAEAVAVFRQRQDEQLGVADAGGGPR